MKRRPTQWFYITMMGAVWKVSLKNLDLLRKEKELTGGIADMDRYGKMIIDRLRTIDEIMG